MKKRIHKLLALLLAMIMVFGMAACKDPVDPTGPSGSGDNPSQGEEDLYYNKTGYPICDEPIEITVSGVQGNSPDWQNTLLVKYVEEKLGIKLICQPMSKDQFKQQYPLMLADPSTMPDLIVNASTDRAQLNADGEDGFWLDMSKYADLMPNLYAFLDKHPTLAAYTKTENGSIYSLTRITDSYSANLNMQIYFNKDVVEAAGVDYDNIKTVDDFYNALKAVKAKYPDKIPFAITPDRSPAYRGDVNLRTAFGIINNNNSYMLGADKNGDVSLADISDNNREYLKFLNKLYSEGLLDPDCFTVTQDEYRANLYKGNYIFYTDTSFKMHQADEDKKSTGDYSGQANYYSIISLTSDLVNETSYIANNGVATGARIYVNAETKYPEAICRLLDFFCTEEGQMLATNGVEGETYKWVEDEYGLKNLEYASFADLEKYESASKWQNGAVVINQAFAMRWGFTGSINSATKEQLEAVAKDPSHSQYWAANLLLRVEKEVDNVVIAPAPLTYTSDETSERSTLYTDINNYLKQMKVEFVTGVKDPNNASDWDAYVAQVKQMGYDRLMEIEQAAWDRMMANAE